AVAKSARTVDDRERQRRTKEVRVSETLDARPDGLLTNGRMDAVRADDEVDSGRCAVGERHPDFVAIRLDIGDRNAVADLIGSYGSEQRRVEIGAAHRPRR